MHGVFVYQKGDYHNSDNLIALDYGIENEPWPDILLRRGPHRVAAFATMDEAKEAARITLDYARQNGHEWVNVYAICFVNIIPREVRKFQP